jgi:S-DNA-T family DNA segregation ATPase FtsK/SpoIIIE
MAKKKRKKVKNDSTEYLISPEKKVKIVGIFILLLSVFVFLSILSYSRYDEFISDYGFFDLFKVFTNNPEFNNKVSSLHNWMGIFGAYSSFFLIQKTIGYFSILFPVITFLWGMSLMGKKNYGLTLKATNFLLAIGILFSTLFGVLRAAPDIRLLVEDNEFSGNLGLFFGKGLALLFGGLGSVIIIVTIIIVAVFFTFNIPIEPIKEFVVNFFKEEEEEIKINRAAEEEERLSKIKNLGSSLKRKKIKEVQQQPLTPEEFNVLEPSEQTETKIRIINKDKEETEISELKEPAAEKPIVEGEKEKKTELPENKEASHETVIDIQKEELLPEQWEEKINFTPPTINLLNPRAEEVIKIPEEELKRNAELLKEKLALFDIKIDDISVTPGPVVTLYEIVPAPGVKISRIVSLENDIALALAARGIRIIAPIPGKSAIGVEIPNAKATLVTARSVLAKVREAKAELPMALGKTISGDVYVADLAMMPHLLIAGSTGSGKSVGINMIINSLLFSKHPSEIKFVIVDPKKIELSFYKRLNKHFLAVSPDLDEEIITTPQNALIALKAVEFEMEKRYDMLAKAGVRDIVAYNKKISNPKSRPHDTDRVKHHPIPYIIVIIDELADLMLTSGKEVEEPIARLAQLARAVGIHLIVATQRPSVNVITGLIKANFSARIAYKVATKIDSRTILDMNGAEQLLGRGDMLFLPIGAPKPIRIQNAFISTEEVEKVVNHIYIQKGFSKRYFLPSMFEKKTAGGGNFLSDLDPMFQDAARVIVRHQQGSVSLLQRRLKLGYARAARIVDQLEQAGIVGPSEGSKAREVLVENEEELETLLRSLND